MSRRRRAATRRGERNTYRPPETTEHTARIRTCMMILFYAHPSRLMDWKTLFELSQFLELFGAFHPRIYCIDLYMGGRYRVCRHAAVLVSELSG